MDSCSVLDSFFWLEEYDGPPRFSGCENHAFTGDASNGSGLEIGEDDNLFVDESFFSIILLKTGDEGSFLRSEVDGEEVELVRVRVVFDVEDLSDAEVEFLPVFERDVGHGLSFIRCCLTIPCAMYDAFCIFWLKSFLSKRSVGFLILYVFVIDLRSCRSVFFFELRRLRIFSDVVGRKGWMRTPRVSQRVMQ